MPPIIVDSSFVVRGGLLLKEAKVPLKSVSVDEVKQCVLQIRKRDYWSYGAFVGKKPTALLK